MLLCQNGAFVMRTVPRTRRQWFSIAGSASQPSVLPPRRPLDERPWSPTDLVVFMKSPFAAHLNRLARERPEHALVGLRESPDAFTRLLADEGERAETAALARFLGRGLRVADLSREARATAGLAPGTPADTQAAMHDGVDVIYQARRARAGACTH